MRGARLVVSVVVTVCALMAPGVAWADQLVVDGSSVGGSCSDARSVEQVSVATPWCSITHAVKAAPSGTTVQIRGGSYPYQSLHALGTRSDYVTLQPYGYGTPAAEPVTIAGISTASTSFLRFRGLHLVGREGYTAYTPAAQIYLDSSHIQLVDDDMSGEGVYMQGASDVLVADSRIHDLSRTCTVTQIGDGGGIFMQHSSDVQLIGNHIEGTLQDAINVGGVPDLLVRGNDVSNVPHSLCGDHTDLVQIEGAARGPMTFTDNVFHDGGQFILRNATGLTIADNLMLRVANWMQLVADPGARIVNNTWWGGNATCSGCGSLLIRDYGPDDSFAKAPFNYVNHMNGTIIENNIMRVFANDGVPRTDYHEDYNILYGPSTVITGLEGEHTELTTPSFADADTDDMQLAPGSAGIDAADASVAPVTDMLGYAAADDPAVANHGEGPVGYRDIGALERTFGAPPVTAGGHGGSAPTPTATAPVTSRTATLTSRPTASTRRSRAPRPALKVVARLVRPARGAHSVRVALRCNADCRITAKGRISRLDSASAASSRRGHPQRTFRVHRARVSAHAGRSTHLVIRIPRGVRATRHGHGPMMLELRLRITARDAAGRSVSRSVTMRVKIARPRRAHGAARKS